MDNIFDDLPSLCPDDESSDDDFDGFQWVTKDAIYEEIAEDSDDGEAEVEEDGPPLRRQRRVYAGGRGTGRPFRAPPRAIVEDEHGNVVTRRFRINKKVNIMIQPIREALDE